MDKGAHFRKCDFQVHTPRDINWIGDKPVTPEDREAYAQDFVRACRVRGIGAVAITDHHDMEFVPFIQRAAAAELDSVGQPLPRHELLVVFPGMELTLEQPCQAILIFDSSFTEDLFPVVYNCLGIVHTQPEEANTAQTVQLSINLNELHEKLDAHPSLVGKYIVLPNVTHKGHQTLMRTGFHGHYTKMPCVGGYTDGDYASSDEGTKSKLEGRVLEWGFKRLGVFQTSDNRQRDFAKLGQDATWVKWAEPTAEALRQACLAKESRLLHETPSLPTVTVHSISVSNARFLGNFVLEFNPQYNAIIGGRGTGKSTILEYLRWALCDEPLLGADEEAADFQNRRTKLIDRTLTENSGSVDIRIFKNGVPHLVRRNAKDKRLLLKIADGNLEPATEEQVRTILPLQAYSQKQLSSVGVRLDQLLKFVETPIRQQLDEVDRQMQSLAGEMREQFARFVRKAQLEQDLARFDKENASIDAQIKATRANLSGISEEDRRTIANRALIDQEERLLETLLREINQGASLLQDASATILKIPQVLPNTVQTLPNNRLAVGVHGIVKEALARAHAHLEQAAAELAATVSPNTPYTQLLQEWRGAHQKFIAEYEQATQRSTAHESVLKQLSDLEERGRKQTEQIVSVQNTISELGSPHEVFYQLLGRWQAHQRTIAGLLHTQCEGLTNLSGERIKATLAQHADFGAVAQLLQTTARGSSIRKERYDTLFQAVQETVDPLAYWFTVLADLQQLALTQDVSEESPDLPATPTLSSVFSSADLVKLASKIGPDEWLSLVLIPIGSTPRFEYMAKEQEYIPFEEASAGQQATALLWALLNQDGPPLVIDQPEDDLDSQIIVQIISQVWEAKSRRQIIFTSHNANLVVNGDAELVVCCDYLITGEQSKGEIKVQGAIDMKTIREEITKVMEGGKEAFKLRKDKYGF